MTAILDDLFADALTIRRKENKTGNLFARASRVARGVPEVMTKITGFGKTPSHIRSHLDYISRKGKITLETDTGEILEGKDIIGLMLGSSLGKVVLWSGYWCGNAVMASPIRL